MATPRRDVEILILCGIGALAAAILAFFWEFTADDSYIYMRYGANLVDSGALVFNQGERVSTMTSPLLALVNAALYALTGAPRLPYKILSVGFLVATVLLVLRHQPRDPWLRALAAAVVALSPSILLWTVGGMETPMLMWVVTATTALALGCDRSRPGRTVVVLFLAGLATVCRQDAVPYMFGLSAFALWGQRPRVAITAIAAGAVLPAIWSSWSLLYYQDLFPTSFYMKPPSTDFASLSSNAAYLAQGFLYTGSLPLAAWLLVGRRRPPRAPNEIHRVPWGPWLGLALQLGYTLTMATVHMMFAFRAVVPYLPVLVLLAGESTRRSTAPIRSGAATRGMAAALAFLVALQGAQALRTYRTTVQGFAMTGEFQSQSVRDFIELMHVAERLINDVRAHWKVHGRRGEHPRIWTTGEGIMPYKYRDAYFFGPLISYRHHGSGVDLLWADYVLFAPTIIPPLPDEIASYDVVFNGRTVRFAAAFNPAPLPSALPATVAGEAPRADSER
jgi:hypothetical protein